MSLGSLRSFSSYKILRSVLLILSGMLLGLTYQSYVSNSVERQLPKANPFTSTDTINPNNTNTNSWSEFVPINKNSPQDFLEFTHSSTTAYIYQEALPLKLIEFCKNKLCIKGQGKNKYPIPLINYYFGLCNNNQPDIFKRDDDVLVNNQMRTFCQTQCQINECCVCGNFHYANINGKTSNYMFPIGWFYYLNPIAKFKLCEDANIPNFNEDVVLGFLMDRRCPNLKRVGLPTKIIHRSIKTDGWSWEIIKHNNHQ